MNADDLKSLPLEDLHRAADAKFAPFAGWSMPLSYPLGVMKEHLHCRESAGLFDISHMRLFSIEGRQADAFLARACPLDPDALAAGTCKYTLLLDEKAGILDDLIVTRLDPGRFMLVANAGNAQADERHLRTLAVDFEVSIEPLDRVFLAIQGPQAEAVLRANGFSTLPETFMQALETDGGCFITRSGYTGEDGFEIALPLGKGQDVAEALLGDERVRWIGLAARDSLRLEAGLCLHGQDIADKTDPVEAGLLWAISKHLRQTGNFVGAQALRERIEAGPAQRRVGLKPEGRQPIRAGTLLYTEDGREIGRVTSGGFGPSAGHPVAMAYVAADHAVPDRLVFAEVRGSRLPVRIHPLPFIPHRYRKG